MTVHTPLTCYPQLALSQACFLVEWVTALLSLACLDLAVAQSKRPLELFPW